MRGSWVLRWCSVILGALGVWLTGVFVVTQETPVLAIGSALVLVALVMAAIDCELHR